MHMVFSSQIAQVPIKALIWLFMSFLQVLHVALTNCTKYFSKTHDHSLNAVISSSCDLQSKILGFAINFDLSTNDDFLSSTAFFTASAAGVVASELCATV